MNPSTMNEAQQSPTWRLAPGQALSLPAAGRTRWLRVVDGEAWLTTRGTPEQPADDCWLDAGALWQLPAGRDAVIEGHPRAAFQLLEPPAVNGASWWRERANRWLRRSPEPACEAC